MGLSYRQMLDVAEEHAMKTGAHLGSCLEATAKAYKRWKKAGACPKDWQKTLKSRWLSEASLFRQSRKSNIVKDKALRKAEGKICGKG